MELEENKAAVAELKIDIATDTSTNTNSNTYTNTDKTPWGLIAVAVINLCIVGYEIIDTLVGDFVLLNIQSNNILSKKMVLISLIVLVCTVIVLLVASIGLILNKTWGWKITAGYYFYRFVDAALSCLILMCAASTPEFAERATDSIKIYGIVRFVFVTIFSLAIFSYLFRKKIRNFFSIKKGPVKLIVIFFMAGIAVYIINIVIYIIIFHADF